MTLADTFLQQYGSLDCSKQWDAIADWEDEGKITDEYDDNEAEFTVCGLVIYGLNSDQIPNGMGDDYSKSGVVYGSDSAHVGLLGTGLDLYDMGWVADKIANAYKIEYEGDVELDGTACDFCGVESITVFGDIRGVTATEGIDITCDEAKELAKKAGLNDFAELCDLYPDKEFMMEVSYSGSEEVDIEFSDGSSLSDDEFGFNNIWHVI